MALATLKEMLFSETADATQAFGTISCTVACQAGRLMAPPSPKAKGQGEQHPRRGMNPSSVNRPSKTAMSSIQA